MARARGQGAALVRNLGAVLREARVRAGLSQEQLAERAGLDRTYIGRIEAGRQAPTIETLDKLARALDIRLSEVLRLCEEREEARGQALQRHSPSAY